MLRLVSDAQIPADMMDLLEGDALGYLATIRRDGSPHVTPLWVDHDGSTVIVDVRTDRVKAANMRARPAVALSIGDPRNADRHLDITGRVVSWSEEGWHEHMNKLARRYLKVDEYPWFFEGERRQIFRIEPTGVHFERG
jgi:PPOX class probable F420-dependent enzyme